MEPAVNLVGAVAAVRGPASSELSQLLGNGRIVAGEVIETLDGGSVVLGIAGQRVTAETQVELEPGQRFLARAEGQGQTLVLRLLPGEPRDELVLLAALRTAIGRELPAGDLLEGLRAALSGAAQGALPKAVRALFASLGEHAFDAHAGGATLAETIAHSGLDTESALCATAAGDPPELWTHTAVARDVARAWVDAWRAAGLLPDDPATAQDVQRLVAAAIVDLSWPQRTAARPSEIDGLPALIRALRAPLVRALEIARGPRVDAATTVAAIGASFLDETGTLARLLELFGLAPATRLAPSARDPFGRDLKTKLLRAASELEPGAARETIERSVDALEAEQLLNVARRRFGEPWHWSIAVPDADRYTSAHVTYADDREMAGEGAPDGEAPGRLVMGVDFSQLGPVRADVFLRPDSLLVRLSVARTDTLARLEAEREALCERLATDGRAVHVSIVQSAQADLVPSPPPVRFLDDHSLMDLSA